MKRALSKIWLPSLMILMIGFQSFYIDIVRAGNIGYRFSLFDNDSLQVSKDSADNPSNGNQKTERPVTEASDMGSLTSDGVADSLVVDSLKAESVADSLVVAARDTIKVPDSLRTTDPLKFKYFIALRDSITRVEVRDSLMSAGDTLELHLLDSLYIVDSTEVATEKFNKWYNSLSKRERKKYDYEQALPGKIAEALRKMEIKDSIKFAKDSIFNSKPRILETYALPDSLHYKRIIKWETDRDFQDLHIQKFDTTYNAHFHEYPFFKNDVNATYLGVIGSPAETYNFFKRTEEENAIFYTPYMMYSYTSDNVPKYNTKTPYTELAYWGTLFANQEIEETNVKVLTTQNITPSLNITFDFHRFGGNGILKREDTDNRNLHIGANYLGKKYMAHVGWIHNLVKKSENGGVVDTFWIRDTTVDAREINVHLREATNTTIRHTVYLDQTYRIPFSFIGKAKERKEQKARQAYRDSLMASGDSIAIQAFLEKEAEEAMNVEEQETEKKDSLNKDITTAFIGHSSDLSIFSKTYTDNIGTGDKDGRDFYHNRFFLNPTSSHDSLRTLRLDNKIFLRLQPWKADGIVSKLDVGIGDKLVSYYDFNRRDYLTGGGKDVIQNSLYVYAGVQGQYKKYLRWNAKGGYTFLGHEQNNFNIGANVAVNFYPFRRDKKSPLTLTAHFETNLKEPDFYQQRLFTNHYKWENNFGKISTTKVEAKLDIPRWRLDAGFGYGLIGNQIYYDETGIVRQCETPTNVLSAYVRKDFKLWKFHLDNKILFQMSSNQSVIPLPLVSLNLRYYFEFDVVKKVMQMQIGANAMFTTKWNAPAYNPVLGVFYNQNSEKFGNCPYIDLFINVQWKRANIFIKVVNIAQGWPEKNVDYFSAAGYIAPQRAIKVGISWPFYIQPGKNKSVKGSGASGGASGGSSGGSGFGGGFMGGGGFQSANQHAR